MIYLFDKNLELIKDGIIKRDDVISSWQIKEINGLIPHTVEFKYNEVADTAEYFGVKDPDFRERFWVYKIVDREKTDNPNGVMKLKGIHKFFDDLKGRGYVQDLRPNNSSFAEYMDMVLEGTGWVRGSSAVTSTVSGSLYYISKAEAFWKLIESAGCEFELTATYSNGVISEQRIDFADEFAVDNGRLYVHGDKLLNVVASTSDEFIPTAFLPRGKGVETEGGGYGRKLLITDVNWSKDLGSPVDKPLGSPILELKDRTAIYGYADGTPRLQVVEFPDITDAEELARAVYQYALDNARQKFQYKANVFENEYISTGERVTILSRKINVVYKVRIFKVERNFLNTKMKKIELGDKIIQSRAEQAIQAKRDEEKKEAVYISLLNEVRNEIAQDWWNTDGYNYQLEAGNEYGLPGGIYSFNASIDQNPNELVGISAGKLIIAQKDDSGNWQDLTGADGKGIHGDSIVANSITANKLASDVGASLDLSSNTSINLTVKENIDDYFQNNPVEVKVEKPFYAYADIDSIVTAIDRPDEVNYEPSNIPYSFDEDITSLIDEHGLDGWKVSYDVKANAETIEELTVLTKSFSKYDSYRVHHLTTLNYEHYEQLITFIYVSSGETTKLGVFFYNTPFSLKNFILKKVKNITNFSTSWTNQIYQGVYVGYERPTDPNAYEWARIQGEDGTSGNDGVGLEGESVIKYGKSDDESTLPTEWFDSPIVVEGGLISWTRTVLTYTDGTITNIDTPFKVPLDGEQGQDGRGIIELQTMYGLSDSKDVEPTEWFAIPPEIKGGDFSWTRIELIFNDGTTEFVKTVTQNADILEVREDGYLYVNGVKTEKKVQGENGYTPYVQDGYWYINGVNTGQKAVGEDGKDASILYRFSNDKSTMSLVDNSHRYVGLYRGTGDVNLASSYVWLDRLDLDALDERTKTNAADIAVNKTDIASKVSQTTYTSDQTKINDQLSTITQDMESWEAKFESIGGTNLLKGSKYVRGWLPINLETITETYANVVQEWDTIDATKVVTNAPDSVSIRKAYRRFEVPTLEEGRLYTFTMYVNNIRTVDEKITLEGGLVGEATIVAGAKTRIVIQGYATNVKYIDVILNSYTSGYYASAIVYKAMLEIGNQVNDWTPHPDEIESGSTRITEEGLTVGKSNSDVQTSIMDNGLFIQDIISGESIAEFTQDGAKTNILTATDIYSDSIIRRQRNSVDVYVGPSMTGDGSGKDSSNRLDNINRAIDVAMNYAHYVTDYATINIYIKGTINEIVMITGVSGYGNINIIGESGSRLVGAIFVNSCTAQVNIKDLNISLDVPDTVVNACLNFHNTTSGNVIGGTMVGQGGGRGVNATKCKLTIQGTQFFDLTTVFIATELGEITSIDTKGAGNTYVESATKGGRLILQGTRPSASRAPTPDSFLPLGGWVLDNSTYASGTRPSFAPPTFASVTKTFYADLATSNSNGYEWLEGEARQGTYNGKINIGIVKFGSKIKDWLAANGGYQGSVTAVVTAKRNRSSGGGTVSFKITSPYTLTLPAVSRGYSSSATAGTSLTGSITTSSNLTLKTSTTSSSDYAGYTSVSIKITTMKKV